MIKDIIHYGAAATKTRAMYGKLLTAEQMEALVEAEDLRALWELLKKCPAWEKVADVLPEAEPMAEALSVQMSDDARRLGCFLSPGEKESLQMFLRYQRQEGMSPEEYQRWWSGALSGHSGLRRIVGEEADALNLVYILRLRCFPQSKGRAKELLIPIRYELKDPLIDRLLRAPNDNGVMEILSHTKWGGAFRSLAVGDLEKQYQTYMEDFCRRLLNSADAGLGVVQALFPLKDIQRRKILRLIGAHVHGIDPHAVV